MWVRVKITARRGTKRYKFRRGRVPETVGLTRHSLGMRSMEEARVGGVSFRVDMNEKEAQSNTPEEKTEKAGPRF